jgi:hypothetical protein
MVRPLAHTRKYLLLPPVRQARITELLLWWQVPNVAQR